MAQACEGAGQVSAPAPASEPEADTHRHLAAKMFLGTWCGLIEERSIWKLPFSFPLYPHNHYTALYNPFKPIKL